MFFYGRFAAPSPALAGRDQHPTPRQNLRPRSLKKIVITHFIA